MKAILHTQYGPPDKLQLGEVDKPAPKADEVLIKIHAASINFGDKALVQGEPFLIRLMGYGLTRPKYRIPGGDMAGVVKVIGFNVKSFQPGDEVFADIGGIGFGAYAEYVAVPESALTPKPVNISFEEAASVPQAAVVALQGLRDLGQIQAGEKVLVNGASGGVGTFAVQIAKVHGAEVTGVCSTANIDLVRSLGVDHVIDYKQDDFTQLDQQYDLIFDIVANRSVSDYMKVLTPTGRYVACAFNPTVLFLGPFFSRKGGKQAKSLSHKANPADLAVIRDLIEAGKISPVVDRIFPMEETADAIQYLGSVQQRGKVVIRIANIPKQHPKKEPKS